MRKNPVVAIMICIAFILTMIPVMPKTAQADMNKVQKEYSVKVFVDSADNEVIFPAGMGKPFIALDRTYIPYRILAEKMGATVGWDGKLEKVTAQNEKNKVEMLIGQTGYKMNGVSKQMEVEPFILQAESRTYVPARFLTEGLGYKIDFLQGGKVMYICSFTKGQSDSEMKDILENIKEKEENKPPVVPSSGKVTVVGNHYYIGTGLDKETVYTEKYGFRKSTTAIGTGGDIFTVYPVQTEKIQVTCTSHPEFNTLDYYGVSDMTRPRLDYVLSGTGYKIQAKKGMVVEFKTSDGDIFTLTI